MTKKERLLKADRKLTKAEWDYIIWGTPIKRTPKKDPHSRSYRRLFKFTDADPDAQQFEIKYIIDGQHATELMTATDQDEAKQLFRRIHPCLQIVKITAEPDPLEDD